MDLDDLRVPQNRIGYVYMTTFTRPTDGKVFKYVGQHTKKKLDRKYIGSGAKIGKLVRRYGAIGNVHVQVLTWAYSQEELDFKEILLIGLARALHGKACLNLTEGGRTGKHSLESRRKMVRSVNRPEARAARIAAHLGSKRRPETCERISRSKTGKKILNVNYSAEARENRAKAQRGRRHTEETLEKMRKSKENISQETRAKLAEALTGYKQVVVTCPFCDASGGVSAMRRWHFSNCRLQ